MHATSQNQSILGASSDDTTIRDERGDGVVDSWNSGLDAKREEALAGRSQRVVEDGFHDWVVGARVVKVGAAEHSNKSAGWTLARRTYVHRHGLLKVASNTSLGTVDEDDLAIGSQDGVAVRKLIQ